MTDVVNLRRFPRSGGSRGPIVLPPDVVRVDRPSPWGNPWRIGEVRPPNSIDEPRALTRADVLNLYRRFAESELVVDPSWLEPLRGKRALACWCAPLPCHAMILVDLLERRPRIMVEPGEAPRFGRDRQPAAIAETAPAWPALATVAARSRRR